MPRRPPPGRKKRIKRYISQGSLCYDKIELLVSLTGIRSKKQIRALESYLVQGFDTEKVCEMFGVTVSNLNRDVQKLDRVAGIIEKYMKVHNGD